MDRRKTLVWDLAEFARRFVLVVLVSGCVLGLHGTSTVASTSEQKQTARVVSVRKVLRTPYIVSRYPQIHYYVLYFALRVSDQTYCGEYETPVLDEIDDLLTCNGQRCAEVVATLVADTSSDANSLGNLARRVPIGSDRASPGI
jgi:hypothetical protein